MNHKNPRWGMTLDAFLDEEGIREEMKAEAARRVAAWQHVATARSTRRPTPCTK